MGNNIEDKLESKYKDQFLKAFNGGVSHWGAELTIEMLAEYASQTACNIITTETTKAANEAALEELEELYTMAKTNYEHTGNPNMKTLGQYCSNRIKALQKEQKG